MGAFIYSLDYQLSNSKRVTAKRMLPALLSGRSPLHAVGAFAGTKAAAPSHVCTENPGVCSWSMHRHWKSRGARQLPRTTPCMRSWRRRRPRWRRYASRPRAQDRLRSWLLWRWRPRRAMQHSSGYAFSWCVCGVRGAVDARDGTGCRADCDGTDGHGERCRPAQGKTTGSGVVVQAAFGFVVLVSIALVALCIHSGV